MRCWLWRCPWEELHSSPWRHTLFGPRLVAKEDLQGNIYAGPRILQVSIEQVRREPLIKDSPCHHCIQNTCHRDKLNRVETGQERKRE